MRTAFLLFCAPAMLACGPGTVLGQTPTEVPFQVPSWAPSVWVGGEMYTHAPAPKVERLGATGPRAPGAWSGAAQEAEEGLSWKRGAVVGALGGAALGLLAHIMADNTPCDTCQGNRSSAEGTMPEFIFGFGIGGALIGALVGAVF